MKKLVLLIVLLPYIGYPQIAIDEKSLLFKTFQFVHNQQFTLNYIEDVFPEHGIEARIAEIEFTKNYSQALSSINIRVKELAGTKFKAYITQLNNKRDEQFRSKLMTEKEALNFIEKVKLRAKGFIESPYLKVIQKYQSSNFPADQIFRGYKVYKVQSYANSRILDLSISVPNNWKEIDGLSSSILKRFRSNYGNGNEVISIERFNKVIKLTSITKDKFHEFIPTNGIVISTKVKTIGNRQVGVLAYEENKASSNLNKKEHVIAFILSESNETLIVYCTMKLNKHDYRNAEIKELIPFYEAIVKSIEVTYKQKEKNIITYKN